MAEGPVGTAKARSGHAHHPTPHDDEERRDEARVHESAIEGGEAHGVQPKSECGGTKKVRARSDSVATSEINERSRGGEAQAAALPEPSAKISARRLPS